jgi:hypothetical protein
MTRSLAMLSQDAEAFETVMQDLCLAFNRPYSPELSRVFWESLKHVHIAEVRRNADAARKTLKKFPTPKDLTPDRVTAPPPKPVDTGPPMSSWAIAANQILFSVAYQGHRGFRSIAKWKGTELLDGTKLDQCLKRKAEYVQMAEDAAATGDVWEPQEFNRMCREGFEALLA